MYRKLKAKLMSSDPVMAKRLIGILAEGVMMLGTRVNTFVKTYRIVHLASQPRKERNFIPESPLAAD